VIQLVRKAGRTGVPIPGDLRDDRLARNIGDLQDIVRPIKARVSSLKATDQPIDTATGAGKRFLDMLRVFAEFETKLASRAPARRHRQGRWRLRAGRPQ